MLIHEPANYTRPQLEMISKRVFFEFATHYLTRHKAETFTPGSFARGFSLPSEEWGKLREAMVARKVTISDSVWTADRPFMLLQVRAELASAALKSSPEAYKIRVEDDSQLQQALELFPQAARLMSGVIDEPRKVATPTRK